MTLRLLLASLLLLLGATANAAMDRFHSASGETGAPCPPTALAEPADDSVVKPDLGTPPANHPAAPASSRSTAAPTRVRPALRWHSFLPGMMK